MNAGVTIITRRCRDCRRPIAAPHMWRCPACAAARIERTVNNHPLIQHHPTTQER
jgi:hypothetical protein